MLLRCGDWMQSVQADESRNIIARMNETGRRDGHFLTNDEEDQTNKGGDTLEQEERSCLGCAEIYVTNEDDGRVFCFECLEVVGTHGRGNMGNLFDTHEGCEE